MAASLVFHIANSAHGFDFPFRCFLRYFTIWVLITLIERSSELSPQWCWDKTYVLVPYIYHHLFPMFCFPTFNDRDWWAGRYQTVIKKWTWYIIVYWVVFHRMFFFIQLWIPFFGPFTWTPFIDLLSIILFDSLVIMTYLISKMKFAYKYSCYRSYPVKGW